MLIEHEWQALEGSILRKYLTRKLFGKTALDSFHLRICLNFNTNNFDKELTILLADFKKGIPNPFHKDKCMNMVSKVKM